MRSDLGHSDNLSLAKTNCQDAPARLSPLPSDLSYDNILPQLALPTTNQNGIALA
jgi:hypothetical protein